MSMDFKFHLSLPCLSISRTKEFYVKNLEATVGRRSQNWIDINFYDHQITFTKSGKFIFETKNYSFGGEVLPSFHFGIILDKMEWEKKLALAKSNNIELQAEIEFLQGKSGQHKSFFVKDPNDYTVEFKCFKEPDEVFKPIKK